MDSHGQAEGASSSTDGFLIAPLASAAALDGAVFSRVNATEAIPAAWEDRARRAWEYYLEEPLVKNCVNSWRSFAVGDEIKIAAEDEDLKWAAIEACDRLKVSQFVKDMILQLLVKGDAVGFKRYAKDGKEIEEVVCVNPVSVKVKYAEGELIEAQQVPENTPGAEAIDLPVEQVIHLKWDAFSGSAVVAYMYKTKGLRVVANDRLRYAHHAARALVENSSVTLTEEEIEALLAENPPACWQTGRLGPLSVITLRGFSSLPSAMPPAGRAEVTHRPEVAIVFLSQSRPLPAFRYFSRWTASSRVASSSR